jgi:DNA-binding SARP family transcriptional activator
MGVLRISLFGDIRVAHEGGRTEVRVTRTVQALLAYLLLYRHRAHPREVLADLFWGGRSEDRARGCLSTALWRLRRVLEPDGVPPGTYLLTTPASDIRFNCESSHWLDVEVFEEEVGQVLGHPVDVVEAAAVEELQQVVDLYTAELLEGFYDDWALRERERLRMLYLNSLAYLMRYHGHQRAYEEALAWGRLILEYDPLREEVHREVMRLYEESGQRALAVRQYQICCEILATELGVPPMEETQAQYAQIVPGSGYRQPEAANTSDPVTLQHALQQIQLAVQDLCSGQEQLRRAIQLLERLAEQR